MKYLQLNKRRFSLNLQRAKFERKKKEGCVNDQWGTQSINQYKSSEDTVSVSVDKGRVSRVLICVYQGLNCKSSCS